MVTLLILSLVIVHKSLIREDLRDYRCHVGSSWAAGRVRNMDVFLQAPGIAETRGKLSRNHKVTFLECYSHQSSVQVNLLHLEKMRGALTERVAEQCTVESLQVIPSTARVPAHNHTCVLRTSTRRQFHRRFIFRMFLAVISNHTETATLLKQKVFSNGSSTPHVHQEKQTTRERIPSSNGKDLLMKQNISTFMKAFIVCILLTPMICYTILFIREISHLCSCPDWISSRWSRSKRIPAASIPEDHQSGTLSAQLLKDTKKSVLCFA
ncbi:uncharacterized protein LOC110407737 isoform X2 [Numida meleagris]|uniref:uncharacterized protein LOC110407737 isoform X2 n=1 Tax=Numida meleagris TaxID=8996 RepID=UPI000B3D8B30|nr:uncharacterized protein LOC110407737 isoform X2 [Numida meleagris]